MISTPFHNQVTSAHAETVLHTMMCHIPIIHKTAPIRVVSSTQNASGIDQVTNGLKDLTFITLIPFLTCCPIVWMHSFPYKLPNKRLGDLESHFLRMGNVCDRHIQEDLEDLMQMMPHNVESTVSDTNVTDKVYSQWLEHWASDWETNVSPHQHLTLMKQKKKCPLSPRHH